MLPKVTFRQYPTWQVIVMSENRILEAPLFMLGCIWSKQFSLDQQKYYTLAGCSHGNLGHIPGSIC